jgi:hypothetical protein
LPELARRRFDDTQSKPGSSPNTSNRAARTMLKKALEDRWPEIIADLDALTETEIEHDGKRFLLRSAPRPAASLALRAAP